MGIQRNKLRAGIGRDGRVTSTIVGSIDTANRLLTIFIAEELDRRHTSGGEDVDQEGKQE